MYGIFTKSDPKVISLLLNATFTALFIEIYGTYELGEGALFVAVYNFNNIGIISPHLIDQQQSQLLSGISEKLFMREILDMYSELGINPKQPIRSQKPNLFPERKALDDVVFNLLDLTQSERDEVYWSVCEMVRNRLEKARSV